MKRPEPTELLTPKHPSGSIASYPALAIEQNGDTFYLANIPKEDLFPFSFVTGRQEDPMEGFQRRLDQNRARDIARYLDEAVGSIPTTVVLSSQEEAEVKYVTTSKMIRFKRVPKAFMILDGQHRLYGYGMTRKQHSVPVAIYVKLTKKKEVGLFIDINTTQRGVPAALLLDIKHLAEKETVTEAELRTLFDYLSKEADSPLHGLLSASEAMKGKLARPAFNRGAEPMLRSGVMLQLKQEKRHLLVKNYLKAMEGSLRDSRLLISSAYFEAFCAIFDEVLRLARERQGNFKLASLTSVLTPLKAVDFSSVSTAGRARLSKNTLVPMLREALTGQVVIDETMV